MLVTLLLDFSQLTKWILICTAIHDGKEMEQFRSTGSVKGVSGSWTDRLPWGVWASQGPHIYCEMAEDFKLIGFEIVIREQLLSNAGFWWVFCCVCRGWVFFMCVCVACICFFKNPQTNKTQAKPAKWDSKVIIASTADNMFVGGFAWWFFCFPREWQPRRSWNEPMLRGRVWPHPVRWPAVGHATSHSHVWCCTWARPRM